MPREHHILKAISSCPIFFVKLTGNVFIMSQFSVLGHSILSVTNIMVNKIKGQGQQVSAVYFNHENNFKTFCCPMNIEQSQANISAENYPSNG